MPAYNELLLDKRWKTRRNEILRRDKLICQQCNNHSLQREFIDAPSLYLQQLNDGNHLFAISEQNNEGGVCYDAITKIWQSELFLQKDETLSKDMLVYYKVDESAQKLIIVAARKYDSRETTTSGNMLLSHPLSSDTSGLKWCYNRTLQVHHLYYQHGRNPWEYNNEALKTLCWLCHEEVHRNETIPVRDENGNVIGKMTRCGKCHGAGVIPRYAHVEHGICFGCRGHRYIELIPRKF